MAEKIQVFLIPGFFGFTNMGEFHYFAHVQEYLERALDRLDIDARITAVRTEPTASIRKRAARLLAVIARAGGQGPIHLIGHSTGGLDARLLVTPGVSLPTDVPVEPVAERVASIVTVSSPHHGTPLASFFSGLLGKRILRLLSLATVYSLRFGRLPLSAMLRLGALFVRLDDYLGWRETISDQLYDQLLSDFSPERRQAVQALLEKSSRDQALIGQLTPEGIDVFNASTTDRPGVRYGSIATAVNPPGLGTAWSQGLDPHAQASHALFTALYGLTARTDPHEMPELGQGPGGRLAAPLDGPVSQRDNDGIVPTVSQVWGELIGAVEADHMDTIGHFRAAKNGSPQPHYDWFASGSGFDLNAFEKLWTQIAGFIQG